MLSLYFLTFSTVNAKYVRTTALGDSCINASSLLPIIPPFLSPSHNPSFSPLPLFFDTNL